MSAADPKCLVDLNNAALSGTSCPTWKSRKLRLIDGESVAKGDSAWWAKT